MKTQIFKLNPTFARSNGFPASVTAGIVIETPRAMYLYGHGIKDPSGQCCHCGRELTHPGSILLGIGPICLHDWTARDIKMDNMTEADKEYIQSLITSRIIDGWVPKSCIKDKFDTDEIIELPANHPKAAKESAPTTPDKPSLPARRVELITYQIDSSFGMKVIFPYSTEDLTRVKSLPGRRFHNEGAAKFWTVPLIESSLKQLQLWGFQIDKQILDLMNPKQATAANTVLEEIPGLKRPLFPYQLDGVQFIESRRGNALVADEMGLGKTAQALAWLQLHPECRPAIIIVPATLKLNWAREAEMWMTNPKVQILSGTKPNVPLIGEIIIINYDILKGWLPAIKEIKPRCMVIDECHYTKNSGAARTKAVKELKKVVPHLIALSGTPIINRPIEVHNVLKMLDPTTPNFFTFGQRYCGAKHNGFGWDFNGASNTEELNKRLTDTIMIRRLKSEVLKDLPDKIRSFVPLELRDRKTYNRAESNFIAWIQETKGDVAAKKAKGAEALVEIETLKQVSVTEKLPAAIEWIDNFLEVDGKLIVFANHKFVIDKLMESFSDRAVKIDGSTSQVERQNAVDRFQNDDSIRLFVGNIKAAGVGITLTAASNVAFLELPWAPGDCEQAEDRAHRIGQKDTVNVYYLLADGTIENRIAELLDSKRNVLSQVLDGQAVEESSLLTELIKGYQED